MPVVQETRIMPVVASEHWSISNLDLSKRIFEYFPLFRVVKSSISNNWYGHKDLSTWSESIQSKIEFLRRASPDALLSQNESLLRYWDLLRTEHQQCHRYVSTKAMPGKSFSVSDLGSFLPTGPNFRARNWTMAKLNSYCMKHYGVKPDPVFNRLQPTPQCFFVFGFLDLFPESAGTLYFRNRSFQMDSCEVIWCNFGALA